MAGPGINRLNGWAAPLIVFAAVGVFIVCAYLLTKGI